MHRIMIGAPATSFAPAFLTMISGAGALAPVLIPPAHAAVGVAAACVRRVVEAAICKDDGGKECLYGASISEHCLFLAGALDVFRKK